MRIQYLWLPAALAVTALPVAASSTGTDSPAPARPQLTMSYIDGGRGTRFQANVRHEPGASFAVVATSDPGVARPVVVARGVIGPDGSGSVSFPGPAPDQREAGSEYHFRTLVDARPPVWSDWRVLGMDPICETLSFNYDMDGQQIPAGMPISDQWEEAGLLLSADTDGVGTDTLIIFDSANPTGGDSDLVTPGPGANNDEALGNLLIIAEDLVDANSDGLVDDPDDEEQGGTIHMEFTRPVTMCALGLLDLDKGGVGSIIRFYDAEDSFLGEIDLPSMGDNSFQEVDFFMEDVSRCEILLISSGAVPFMRLIPCPIRLNVDANSFGVPTDLEAGQVVVTELNVVDVDAENNAPSHPDAVMVFDTSNPTGGDTDLVTPGPGIGNDTPLGQVLVIAENAVDANADGLVDDPDDEAAGGILRLRYPVDVTFESATVIDVDTNEMSSIWLLDANDILLAIIPLQSLGDNSVQTVAQEVILVRTIELHLGGSGALAEVKVCPTE